MNKLKMVKEGSEWVKYEIYAERWSPYKTIASLHLYGKWLIKKILNLHDRCFLKIFCLAKNIKII